MASYLVEKLTAALAQFRSATRMYEFFLIAETGSEADLGSGGLLVEAFVAMDAVQTPGMRDVIVLSTNAYIDGTSLLGQQAAMAVSLADGSRTRFHGEITEVAMLGSEGGFARYRLRLTPWTWRLTQVRNSRVWQDRTVIEIVDDVLGQYAPLARWRWSDETVSFMDQASPRSYCCQYRESDLDFIERLLTEEGLGWRHEQLENGVGLVIFADTTQICAVPEDASSEAENGIRFHGARSAETSDTIQVLQRQRKLCASLTTLLSHDYKATRAITASAPSRLTSGKLPPLESYDVPGQYAFLNAEQARRYADIQMEAREAAAQTWHGRSTVRTMAAGTRIAVTQGPLQQFANGPGAFVLLKVVSIGINNLPSPARQALAELFGAIPELLEESTVEVFAEIPADFYQAVEQASATGYANVFDAVAADIVWRPQLAGSDGRTHSRPTAHGAQSAIVVGADGSDSPAGADELHCDRLGRVRIRFHWQDRGNATCWVRVAQRAAGGGMGSQFLPRIGQEVLVQFLENDIDRPIIVGALYNGRGEGGIAPTPGGQQDDAGDAQPFTAATDHRTSAQGNLAAGNSPVWHGASADHGGHRNDTAQWGVRTKEFGGTGYNQLLFDDTNAQGRVQLRSTHASSELNLGHLIHSADNYRGSFRGQGAELRTDAYGAVRAGAGLLISSYKLEHGSSSRDPAGDNAPGIALLKQAVKVAQVFSEAASTHRTVTLAAHVGASKTGASKLDENEPPLAALLTAVSGMVDSSDLDAAKADAQEKKTAPDDASVPHTSSPIIAISAKAGLGITAGQAVQLANGETISLMSGADSQYIAGGQLRVHSRQAIGILGGAVQPGEAGFGVQMIAAQGEVVMQAQGDELKVQAREEVSIISANATVDWAAAKTISLSTAGGANITIAGGNITVQAPGKITINAGKKSFNGPEKLDYPLPKLPRSVCVECLMKALRTGSALSLK